MNPSATGIQWRIQKYENLFGPLLFRNAPSFIRQRNPGPLTGEIPVFTFHSALPETFERQCRFLAENGYKTLSADEFYQAVVSPGRKTAKEVVLTFDDGLKHVWTVVYPILKKYGFKAVCFLIPGCVPEGSGSLRPNLEDFWRGKATMSEIVTLGRGPGALATWPEIKFMHESGIIDFQSHTMNHHLVFVSNKIRDFVHPAYNKHFYGNIHVPLYSRQGKDVFEREPLLGMPIYESKPRMSAERRYFDDEAVRLQCVEWVAREGADKFFKKKNWRRVLRRVLSDSRGRNDSTERYEAAHERDADIFKDLRESKEFIEKKLPGKKVEYLCFPWYEAAEFSVAVAVRAGFKMNYFGGLWNRPTNRPGGDPLHVVRLEEFYLQRLPGKGRIKILDVFRDLYEKRNLPDIFGISGKN